MHVCTSIEEMASTQLTIVPHPLHVVPTFKLLWVTLDNYLSWKQHVASMVKMASYKLYMLRCLRLLGTPSDELKAVYTSFILPKLVYANPTWSSSLNITQSKQLGRVQRRACKITLGPAYVDYDNAVVTLNLPRLYLQTCTQKIRRWATTNFSSSAPPSIWSTTSKDYPTPELTCSGESAHWTISVECDSHHSARD